MERALSEITEHKHIVIGLGSGRSGTASLASLIDRQVGGICFHEMNPSCAVFSGNAQSHLNTVQEFRSLLGGGARNNLSIDYSRPVSVATYARLQTLPELNLVGDIAYYYLNYVDAILEAVPECVFVCIKRDKESTVNSWLRKSSIQRWPSLWLADRIKSLLTRTPYLTEYNHWQEHDGSEYQEDLVWDSCFPKFEASSKEDAIRQYWDYYYLEAEKLSARHPNNFRIFDIADLSSAQGQEAILSFIGLSADRMEVGEDAHLHKSS